MPTEGSLHGRVLPLLGLAPNSANWFFAGSVPAHEEDYYLAIAPTLADSTVAQGMHHSVYFVRAATSDPGIFFDSPADSGYSIDNLAPSVPQNLVYDSAILSWDESIAADFEYFTVYGSNTDSFGSTTLIDYTTLSTLNVSASPYGYYFVTTTDFSGNESAPASTGVNTGVGGPPSTFVLSVRSFPNPFHSETTVGYTLPEGGRVAVVIYDALGSPVHTLVDEEKPAGTYSIFWNGRDGKGIHVESGIYLVRASLRGRARSYKMLLLK